MRKFFALLLLLAPAASACLAAPPSAVEHGRVCIAHLGDGAERKELKAIGEAVAARHTGYALSHAALKTLGPQATQRLLIVTQGSGLVGVQRQSTRVLRELTRGDLIFLRPGQRLFTREALEVLILELPQPWPPGLPTFIPMDAPATSGSSSGDTQSWEDRRVDILNWLPNGEQPVYQGVNIKFVRVSDAPTHYHPEFGGFDEIVFLLEASPGAAVLVTDRRQAIEQHTLAREELGTVFRSLPLSTGDLLFVPRGSVHRPIGRSTAIVLALPGFIPGAEIRLDQHLEAINKSFGLEGALALPRFSPKE